MAVHLPHKTSREKVFMLDGSSTTVDWQKHTGDICVLPVGSVEQHDAHLPLLSDCLSVEYFARMVAEDLGAALLPVQPYGNCLEHSGFRGSMTLRPETLMQVVRDLADEVERQGFRIMVLMNGHGGNSSLQSVARDINRVDRPLKILLVSYWEFADPAIANGPHAGKEIHAGEWETSMMMALTPKLVGRARNDLRLEKGEVFPLERSDLTMFGTGHFNPTGAMGFPSRASSAKGRAIMASVRKRMLPVVRDRIARLRRDSRYAGVGGLVVRQLVESDLDACMALKDAAGWNQVVADWRLTMALNPQGCFGAVQNGRLVGTAVVVEYGKQLSWIGMVLVDPQYRGRGIGRQLMEQAIRRGKSRTRVVMLDAAAMGRPLYEKLGFKECGSLTRMTGKGGHGAMSTDIRSIRTSDMPAIARLDRAVFGCNRLPLLDALRRRKPEFALVLRNKGGIAGFCFGRDGSGSVQVGPIVARTPEDAMAMVDHAIAMAGGSTVAVDIIGAQPVLTGFLAQRGFNIQRSFTRMYLGKTPVKSDSRQFAAAGPEFG